MAKDRNSRGKFRQHTTRKPAGGRDLRGDLDDDGKFASCGYCGFINSLDRVEVGGDSSLPNISYAKTIVHTDEGIYPFRVPVSNVFTHDGQDFCLPRRCVTFYIPTVNQFCAFCGSPNWYK